jgi:hypothetical protein
MITETYLKINKLNQSRPVNWKRGDKQQNVALLSRAK